MSKIVVLSKAEGFCPACVQTKRFLEREGVEYIEIPCKADTPEFIKVNEATGYRNMPIVLPNGLDDLKGAFCGFQPSALKGLLL